MSSVEKLGKFEITGHLGQGSFGVVYLGRDPHLNREVAIKVCTLDDHELRERFLREAAISGQLDHPNIVTVHEYSGEGETPYLVQELLSGQDLREVIKGRQPWSVERRLDTLVQVAHGLSYAHAQGVIHRDIKPANIRVLDDGRVKIMDFGIAKLANDESRLTQKGVTMGTASYLPPEQVRGGDIDHRSDLFSFGVLAYELMTFERPFRGKTISALVYQILYKVPAPLATVWPDCPPELSDLVASCLEKEPGNRPSGAVALVEAFESLAQRLAAGDFPTLVSSTPPPRPASVREEEGSSSTSDVLSQSMITRTAQQVSEQQVQPSVLGRDSEATQPVPIVGAPPPPPAPGAGAAGAHDEMATVKMKMPVPPESAGPPGGADAGGEPELATSGLEIGKLVAQGDLDAAMEQLEETIHRQRSEVLEEAGIDPEMPTAQLPPTAPPMAPASPPQVAGAPVPQAPGEQALRPPGKPPIPKRGPGQLPVPLVVGAGAAVVILALVLAFLVGREPAPPPPAPAAQVPAPPPVATPAEERGGLLIMTTPWAEILEITDAAGYVHDLPEDPSTPLYAELPEGLFRVTLTFPASDDSEAEERICEVRIAVGEVATCTEVMGEPSVTDLFKETGWWQ